MFYTEMFGISSGLFLGRREADKATTPKQALRQAKVAFGLGAARGRWVHKCGPTWTWRAWGSTVDLAVTSY